MSHPCTQRRSFRFLSLLPVLGALATLPGCNAGLAAIGLASEDSSSDDDARPVVSDLSVPRSASSPAPISFVVFDEEGQRTDVSVRYRAAGGGFADITLGPGSNPLTGVPSNPGVPYVVLWDFAADLGGTAYRDGLEIQVVVANGVSPAVATGVAMGNDAPEMLAAAPLPDGQPEYGANVDVGLTVRDSAGDAVRVRVEFNDDAAGGFPDGAWRLARPAATPAAEATPEYAITGLVADPSGTQTTFRWDTAYDLTGFDDEVRVRFTPDDPFEAGASRATAAFRLDNNAVPSIFFEEGSLIAGKDELREIAIPFTVFDDEGDDVQVVLQWREEGGSFPALPADPAEVARILADPVEREAYRIVREVPVSARGRVVPVGPTKVRLPEVASSAATVLHARVGVSDDELAILRPSSVPRPLGLPADAVSGPVAAIPVGEGLRALVLDAGGGGWRVREVELATGALVRTLAEIGSGSPSAMALERGGAGLIVAEQAGGGWQLWRVDVERGGAELLAGATGPSGSVRGLASAAAGVVLATAGSTLWRVEYASGEGARVVAVRDGFSEPWGLLLDPLLPNRVYLAERGATGPGQPGRVVVLALDTMAVSVVAAHAEGLPGEGLPRPTALAFEERGSRLLVLTDANPSDGTRELRGLDLNGRELGLVYEITAELPDDAAGLNTGPEGLRVVALPGADDLAVGGGVEQVREVRSYDPSDATLEVDRAFDPPLEPNDPWRWTRAVPSRFPARPSGATGFLVWDSEERPPGEFDLRLTCFDSDGGEPRVTTVPKRVRSPLQTVPIRAGGERFIREAIAADVNGDGLVDVVGLAGSKVDVYLQERPGVFSDVPDRILATTGGGALSLAVADLDDDGRIDIVAGCSSALNVFLQAEDGSFPGPDAVIAGGAHPAVPMSLVAADLNGDHRLDLANTNSATSDVSIYFQAPDGTFPDAPDRILAGPPFLSPQAVVPADLDRDGRLDLVVGDFNSQALALYLQLPPVPGRVEPGTFGAPKSLSAPRAAAVVVADLDDDALVDIAAASGSANAADGVSVFLQDGVAGFPDRPSQRLTEPSMFVLPALSVGDLDGDERFDLAVASRASEDVRVFRQTPEGVLSGPVVALGGPGLTPTAMDVRAAEIDGDGRLDLLVGDGAGGVPVFLQAGVGRFSPAPDPVLNLDAAAVALADVDGDGQLDLVAPQPATDELAVFLQSGSGRFPSGPSLRIGGPGNLSSPVRVAAADWNGDGRVDLATVDQGNRVALFLQASDGGFEDRPDFSVGGPATTPSPLLVLGADLNDDGRLDLVTGSCVTNDLSVFFQTPERTFLSDPDRTLGGPSLTDCPVAAAAADLDGDGLVDLVCANATGNTLTVFRQGPVGEFPDEPSHVLGGAGSTLNVRDVAIGDLDGDGRSDLASANANLNSLTLFLQRAGGGFSATPDVTLSTVETAGARGLALGDLDGDGRLDVVSAGGTNNDNVSVFLQTSPGRFSAAPDIVLPDTGSGITFQVEAADVNSDGQADLVSLAGTRANVFLSE